MERKGFLINKAFNRYLLASVLTVAATQIAFLVDASLVGNLIGPEGLAAVVVSNPIIQGVYALSCLFIPSCTMLAGMAIGGGKKEKADTLFTFSLLMGLAVGVVLTVVGVFSLDTLADVLCKSDAIRPLAIPYMKVTVLSTIPVLIMLNLQQFVETDGSPRTVTAAVIMGNIVNIVGDVVLIKYCGWGIEGAAWATFTMTVVTSLLLLRHFTKQGTLRFSVSHFHYHNAEQNGEPSFVNMKEIVTFGIPLFLSTGLISVQMACYNNIAAMYMGSIGLVVLAVCMQMLTFSMIILTGTLRTIQPIGAILCGIGDSRGMIILLRRAYRFMTVCLAVFVFILVFFPLQIAALIGVSQAEAEPLIMQALPAFSTNIVMQALLYNLMPVYQFYGHHRMALFLSLGQTLLPIVGFWALASGVPNTVFHLSFSMNPWFGFFLGQLVTAVVLLISAEITRQRHKILAPIVLIPRTEYPTLEFSYGLSADDLHQSFDEMSAWLKSQELDKSVIFKVRVIAEELMSNITRHSEQISSDSHLLVDKVNRKKSAWGATPYADVRLVVRPDAVTFSLTDSGIPFNPIENKDKGYGLMIANGAASSISYKYQFNQNMTTIVVNRDK